MLRSLVIVHHRILLADDSVDEQFLFQRALHTVLPDGASIHVVSSGNEAIAYMIGEGKFGDRQKHPFPTVVVTDLNMDDGDGFDVLEFLKENPAWSIVPRIVFSSSENPDDVRTSFLLGASAYHLKGGGSRVLEKQLRQILEYWASSQVPTVDQTGRLLKTSNIGRRANRYPQP